MSKSLLLSSRNASFLKRPKSNELIILFSAYGDDPRGGTGNGALFLKKSGILDKNILMLKEEPFQTKFYLNGIDSNIYNLKILCDEINLLITSNTHIKKICCFGNSSGGVGALLVGALINANFTFGVSVIQHTLWTFSRGFYKVPILRRLNIPRAISKWRGSGSNIYLINDVNSKVDSEIARKYSSNKCIAVHFYDSKYKHGVSQSMEETGALKKIFSFDKKCIQSVLNP